MSVIVHESKCSVALSAKEAADLARIVTVVHRQGLFVGMVATDCAATVLLGEQGLVLFLGDAELATQLLTPVARPDSLGVSDLIARHVGSSPLKPGFGIGLLNPGVRLTLLAPTAGPAPGA